LQSAPLARPLGLEQRQLPAPCVGADERECIRPVDNVHPDAGSDEVGNRVAIRDPQRDVVERLRRHAPELTDGLLPGVDRPLKLLLAHLRAARDLQLLGLVVQLLLRPPPGWFVPERRPPRLGRCRWRDREACRASPFWARSLFTVLAAISLARLVDEPPFFALSLMCSYWRSRLLLHAR
jgi:hypothetical protein